MFSNQPMTAGEHQAVVIVLWSVFTLFVGWVVRLAVTVYLNSKKQDPIPAQWEVGDRYLQYEKE